MDLIERYGPKIQADLQGWAQEHVKQHPTMFALLDRNTERYPEQRIKEHTIEGDPLKDTVLITSIARDVYPNFDRLSEATDKNSEALQLIGEILESGQNVVLGTDHAELIDIAVLLVKVKTALLEQGYEFDTSIIVSKMVPFLGVKMDGKVTPAIDLLKLAVEETYLSIPNTGSSKIKMTTPRRVLAAYNETVIEHGIRSRQKKSRGMGRAMLLGVALSGTVNKPLSGEDYASIEGEIAQIPFEEQERAIVIGKASVGSVRFMENALSVPASATLREDNIAVTIANEAYSVRTPEKLVRFMQRIAKMQAQNDPDHYFAYDEFGNLPVRRGTT